MKNSTTSFRRACSAALTTVLLLGSYLTSAQTNQVVGLATVGHHVITSYYYKLSSGTFVSPAWTATNGGVTTSSLSGDNTTAYVSVFWSGTVSGSINLVDGTINSTLNVTIVTCATLGSPTSLSASPSSSFCAGTTTTLTATPGTSSNTVQWFATSTGGTSLGKGTYKPVPWAATTYYAGSYDSTNGCAGSSRASVSVTPTAIPSAVAGFCLQPIHGKGKGTLIAGPGSVADAGGTIRWYTAENGGTYFTTGSPFVTDSLTTTTTYYATVYNSSLACEGHRTAITVQVLPALNPNYVMHETVRTGGVLLDSGIYNLSDANKNTTIAYTDGLGRTRQLIGVRASPKGKDVVQPYEYDAFGNTSKDYLPYATTATSGSFQASYKTSQAAFYFTTNSKIAYDSTPYALSTYEASPLSRILEQGGVGHAWQPKTSGAPHTKRVSYSFNTGDTVSSAESVRRFAPDGTSAHFYAANILSRTAVTDENGNNDIVFKDALGRTMAHKQELDGTINGTTVNYLQTYYVYNDLNQLAYIIPPGGVAALITNSWTLSSTILDQHVHQFVYDTRGRLTQKKTPGQAWSYYVYDNLNRLVLTQDGNLRPLNKWAFVKYDAMGRKVMAGLYTNTTQTDLTSVQGIVNGQYTGSGVYYEARGTTLQGYTNQSFPTTNADASALELWSVNYYDTYDFDNNGATDYKYDSTQMSGTTSVWRLNGLGFPTGSKRIIVGTTTWLYSYVYYDKYNRPIQTRGNNHLNTSSIDNLTTVAYDFEGKVMQTKMYHDAGGSNQTTVVNTRTYDAKGRSRTIRQVNNTDAGDTLAHYNYNELGQLVEKNLHNTTGTTYLQSVDYRYTIQGRLSSINNAELSNDSGVTNDDTNDYFGMELYYNKPEGSSLGNHPYFNGNISAIKWNEVGNGNSSSGQRSYKFNYDKTDKLLSGTFKQYGGSLWNQEVKTLDEMMSYDYDGNILTLSRKQNQRGLSGTTVTSTAQTVDSLTYTYTLAGSASANQLGKVADAAANTAGFSDGTNSGDDYTYDAHGNLLSDQNKGIDSVKYNVLGKPYRIKFHDGRVMVYKYDAAGTKLEMAVTKNDTTTTTDYVNGFVYVNSALNFFSSPEGRVVKNGSTLEYQYAIADHQGNTRVVFTSATPTPTTLTATFEGDSGDASTGFMNMPSGSPYWTTYTAANHTPGGGKVIRMNQGYPVGPTKSLKVYPGDSVALEVYTYYENNTGYGISTNTAAAMITAVAGAFGGVSGAAGESGYIYNGVNSAISGFGLGSNPVDNQPSAYLNYILFDQNYKVVDMGWQIVPTTALNTQTKVSIPKFLVKEAGFIFVYLSYEDESNNYVEFDDLKITYTPSRLLQYNEYYPFGLQTAQSWTRDNTTNNFLYNQGSEWNTNSGWYDLPYRNYDAALGRFFQVDPKSVRDHNSTPYNYAGNNPVSFNDPNGDLYPMGNGITVLPGTGGWHNTGDALYQAFWAEDFNQSVADQWLQYCIDLDVGAGGGGGSTGSSAGSGSGAGSAAGDNSGGNGGQTVSSSNTDYSDPGQSGDVSMISERDDSQARNLFAGAIMLNEVTVNGQVNQGAVSFPSYDLAMEYMQEMSSRLNRLVVGFGLSNGTYVVLPSSGYAYKGRRMTKNYVVNGDSYNNLNTNLLPYKGKGASFQIKLDDDWYQVNDLMISIPDVSRYYILTDRVDYTGFNLSVWVLPYTGWPERGQAMGANNLILIYNRPLGGPDNYDDVYKLK